MTQLGDGIRRFRTASGLFIALLILGGGCQDTVTGLQRASAGLTVTTGRPQLSVAVTGATWMGAGNIGNCSGTGDEATEALMDGIPGTVFTTGNSTTDGTLTSLTKCYEPSWGKLKSRTRPAAGKKDYLAASGAAYYSYYGVAAGDADKGYYSYDVGDWHIIVLNTNLPFGTGAPQEAWLKSDLAANTKLCQAAVWQLPRYYSSDGSSRTSLKAVWDDLYVAGTDVIVNGDWSWYERFAPQNSAGALDSTYGIREFIVGTGGQGSSAFGTAYPNSEVRIANTLGVLKMTLGANAYAWNFLPVAGKTATDSGSYTCHGAPLPEARLTTLGTSGAATISVDASSSTDPVGAAPLTYAWDFGDGATGTGVKTTHTYTANGTYLISLVVTNGRGTSSLPATTTATVSILPDDPAGSPVLVGAGNVGNCSALSDDATASLLDGIPGTVMVVGNQTVDGSDASVTKCYAPSWGRHKDRTRPAPGKKDYTTSSGAAYYAYYGASAGTSDKGYYSYDTGDWHVVVLNSNLPYTGGSPQEQWLRSDLASSSKLCQAAVWQLPRFYSYDGSSRASLKVIWDDLYAAGAEVIVNGDWSWYERFAPLNGAGVVDQAFGMREFVVGTGGQGLSTLGSANPNSEVRIPNTYGVLRLALNSAGYSWQFVPVAGSTSTDIGQADCHPSPLPAANPGGPYSTEGQVQFDGGGSFDATKQTPLTYAWSFGDGTTGTGVAPMHSYSAFGTYTVTLTVTNAIGVVSVPASTTVTVANLAPTVMMDATAGMTGAPVEVTPLFNDAAQSGPWTYILSWGDGQVEQGTVAEPGAVVLSHAFLAPGGYTAAFTATDRLGASATKSVGINVADGATPPVVLVGAGDIAECSSLNDEATARLIDGIAGTVFTLGDNVYESGTATEYANCYTPSWGRHLARTRATIGNHEYTTTVNAAPTFDYFGAGIGVAGKGYYSYALGNWHIIVLNSAIDMSPGSPQLTWLHNDLTASHSACTLAMWHHPLFSSGSEHGNAPEPYDAWKLLNAAGAEVVLNGHDHDYERFAPQTADGVADPSGIREFVVGTGGKSTSPFSLVKANSEMKVGGRYGVIKLTLSDGAYQWEFVATDGTIWDSGTATCH